MNLAAGRADSPIPAPHAGAIQLSLVLPTYNERANIEPMLARLDTALGGINWEAIFVDDDSPDQTASWVKEIAQTDNRIRCIRRIGRRGLAGACIEGILSSSALFVAVLDADLQHDEKLLPKMLAILESGAADLVVGSRYVEGGSAETFGSGRGAISQFATRIARRGLGTSLSDPMSGFFMARRDRLDPILGQLTPAGFKILLDIVTSSDGLRLVELPYSFGTGTEGESKFSVQIGFEFLGLLAAKLTGDFVDPRFIFFAVVGTTGLVVHLTILKLSLIAPSESFQAAQTTATIAAMASNFFLNNEITYRDRRLKGLAAVRGFVTFCAFCSIGALANIDIASRLFHTEHEVWWVAGAAGAIMSALWNYAMSSMFVWRTR